MYVASYFQSWLSHYHSQLGRRLNSRRLCVLLACCHGNGLDDDIIVLVVLC